MMTLLVIGHDPGWRARMERILGMRAELDWIGAYAPSQRRPGHRGVAEVLLLDGDDDGIERSPRRPMLAAPRRLYVYRQPDVAAWLQFIANKAHA